MTTGDRRGLLLRGGLLVGLASFALVAWSQGWFDLITRENLQRLSDAAGVWGPLAFLVLFAVGELLHVPSVIFVVVAGMVWPLWVALPTAFVGSLVASAVVFGVARVIVSGPLGAMIRKRLPEAVTKYDDALVERGVRTVAWIRFFTFMSPVMHWVLAASRVRFRDMMMGTALGLAPGVTALVLGGDQAVAHWRVIKPWALGALAMLVLVQLVRHAWRRRRGASAKGT